MLLLTTKRIFFLFTLHLGDEVMFDVTAREFSIDIVLMLIHDMIPSNESSCIDFIVAIIFRIFPAIMTEVEAFRIDAFMEFLQRSEFFSCLIHQYSTFFALFQQFLCRRASRFLADSSDRQINV